MPLYAKAVEMFSNDPASNRASLKLNHVLEDALPRGQPDWLRTCWAPYQGWSLGPSDIEGQVSHVCGTSGLLSSSKLEWCIKSAGPYPPSSPQECCQQLTSNPAVCFLPHLPPKPTGSKRNSMGILGREPLCFHRQHLGLLRAPPAPALINCLS